jgi:hypothetical protein
VHTDGLVLLAVDAALLAAIFLTAVRIAHRLDRIEQRLLAKPRKKSSSAKRIKRADGER